jgi:hypothetical protein
MMEAVRTSDTSAHLNVTARCYIPEDSKLQVIKLSNIFNLFMTYILDFAANSVPVTEFSHI